MKSSFSDLKCRLCGNANEDQDHIVNCPMVKDSGDDIDISSLRKEENEWRLSDKELQDLVTRVAKFEELSK